MTISTITIKFLGQKGQVSRVIKNGEVVKVFNTKEEAQAWIDAQ